MSAPHPPKVETFDPDTAANIDNKGISREVDEFRVEPYGLYMARPAPGRAQFHYIESWLLPARGLRVTDFWFSPGHERDQDFYLDVVDVETDGNTWRATDLYLDIVLRDGKGLEVIDTDELLEATVAGLITEKTAQRALETTYATVAGLAAHGYRLRDWLATTGEHPTWRRK
ncbi:DUF402 domain-containing protein [Amycolatopsis magusensis]|uniref:RNA-binding protein associated with RNAse of E/G family n=1 Tax=Amycolatopsis magusensis TaxID=882444 RepID=A0ABS4PS91_9PSEU|nr:DUF402 domain-containing protein [Amycolatopsis magusensis]MBP2182286.1 putative RNA-binding protein associated with RNAse of E/G family [Amycolatopsis magusensis]MDI5976412.1 DUF402 domain-containing protein [Amycolatopsis magusensis]